MLRCLGRHAGPTLDCGRSALCGCPDHPWCGHRRRCRMSG